MQDNIVTITHKVSVPTITERCKDSFMVNWFVIINAHLAFMQSYNHTYRSGKINVFFNFTQ